MVGVANNPTASVVNRARANNHAGYVVYVAHRTRTRGGYVGGWLDIPHPQGARTPTKGFKGT